MPIEIREVVINVETNNSQTPANNNTGGANNTEQMNRLKKEIFDACMEKFKELLKEKETR